MSHPLTDIIVLVHNRLDITKTFVDHLYKNTNDFRVLFVENGSTDNGATKNFLSELSKKEENCNVIYSDKNLGVIGGRNLGAERCFAKHPECEWFVNVDNDQFLGSDWLNQLHSIAEKDYSVVGADAWQLYKPNTDGAINMGGQLIHDRSYFPFKHCLNKRDKFTYVGCGGCLIKKEVYDKIGLFDLSENSMYFEDPHFSFKAAQNDIKYMWCYNCNINHIGHQTINTQKTYNKNEEFLKGWAAFKKKWYPYFPPLLSVDE